MPAQAQQPGDQASGTLSGTVLNSVTHEPIGRALVYSMDERSAAFTDDHGHFELTLPAPPQPGPNGVDMGYGQFPLQATKPGFLSDSGLRGSIPVGDGQKEVTLSLVPEALIVGQVKFPSAEAADRARVQLYHREVRDGFARWVPATAEATRADGEFRFAGLRAGEYKLFTLESMEDDPLTSAPNGPAFGFPPRYFAAARDFATADAIQVHAGETITANLAPERQRYYDVKIPVIVPQPADFGLTVSVFAQGHRGPGFELGYDRSQHAILGSLPNGAYTIEASSTGPAAATGTTNITVTNGQVNGAPLGLAQNPSIEINIRKDLTAADKTPAQREGYGRTGPEANVVLQPAEELSNRRGPGIPYYAQGNPPTLSGVRPGRYWVQVQIGQGYVSSLTSGGKDLLRAPLVVPYGASVPPIEIDLRYDTGEIEVTVEGAANASRTQASAGAIQSGGSVEVFRPDRGFSVYCVPLTNEGAAAMPVYARVNDNYVLQGVPPGDYRILAFDAPQQLEYRNPAAMRAYESKGQAIHVAAGQKAHVTVQMIASE
jgi:hypothetical protein